MNTTQNTTPRIDWKAGWIWTRGRTRRPYHVSFFRAAFEAGRRGRDADILCAADSRYRLWLNGEPVGFGPARGHPEHPYYDTHRVRLRPGRNVIAFRVQHYTDPLPIFAPVRGGLICQVQAGDEILAATGSDWRALPSDAYTSLPGILYPEQWDARREPADWEAPGFNDGKWPRAVDVPAGELAPPSNLLPRPIPQIPETRRTPRRVIAAGPCHAPRRGMLADDLAEITPEDWRRGQATPTVEPGAAWPAGGVSARLQPGEACAFAVDFGLETLASPELALRAKAGMVADLGYSEALLDNRVATRWQGLRQSERLILRDGATRHRLLQPRGFRYLLLRLSNPTAAAVTVNLDDLAAYEAIYPLKAAGSFECSDPLLNRIHALAVRTLNLCMEDAYTDCPWRERSQYVGDFQIEGLSTYYTEGAGALANKAVAEFASGSTPEGWVPAVFPVSHPHNLPTWGMRLSVLAWDHYRFTGNRDLLKRSFAAVQRQMAYFAAYEQPNGTVAGMKGYYFVDWTPLDAQNANEAVVQGWYLEALETTARMARELKQPAEARRYAVKARRLRRTLAGLWDEQRGAFRRYLPGSTVRPRRAAADTIGQHENFLFNLLGIGTPAQRRRALDTLAGTTGRYLPNLGDYQSIYRGQWKSGNMDPETVMRIGDPAQGGNVTGEAVIRIGSPFWSFYALQALLEAGRTDAALEYMRLCWGLMLEFGDTSCWEMWDRHTSLCHGWSSAPAVMLPAYMLGIRPRRPGFKTFDFAPQPGDLSHARGTVPTPHGPVHAGWRIHGDRWTGRLTVPEGTAARFAPPPGYVLDARGGATRRAVTLGPGTHTLSCTRRPGA